MQELAPKFTTEHKAPIEFDLGGSETLLPKILAGARADIFVCHDPFEYKLKAAGRWTNTVVVGYLEPVLAVRARQSEKYSRLRGPGQNPASKLGSATRNTQPVANYLSRRCGNAAITTRS